MKKLAVLFALLGLFIAGGAWAGPPTMIYPAAGISTASDCNVAAYYAIGKLCQDTDDGKLYKGTGAAVEEVGATTIATAITVADTTDATSYCALFESATGDLGPKTDGGCTYAADTGTLTVTGLTVGAGGITTAASASPTAIYNDSDAPGADKEIAKTVGAYIDGADGAENGTLSLYAMIAGTDTEMLKVDGKNSRLVALKPLGLLSANDPDVAVEGDLAWDANGDVLRGFDGTRQVAAARVQEEIHVTVYKPQDLDDAQRDHFWIWSNESGMSFIVTGWKGWSTSDDTTVSIKEEDADGANDAEVDDTCEMATGAGPYTGGESGKSATIENGHLLYLDFDDTDAPALVKITIYGYYTSDVN